MSEPLQRPIRVLVADDHTVAREGVKSLVAGASDMVVVGEAADGVEALELALLHRPDVLVLDIRMPRGGGLETLRALRSAQIDIAVLILSFHSETMFAVPFLREGANGYLAKENAADALVEAIRRVKDGGKYVSPLVAEQLARRIATLRAPTPHDRLSAQELIVLALLAAGKPLGEIGAELLLSRRAIQRCYERIVDKTGLLTPTAVIQYALNGGIAGSVVSGVATSSL
jgi:DNA-binding NarL/FixJ family response regulator